MRREREVKGIKERNKIQRNKKKPLANKRPQNVRKAKQMKSK